MLAFSSCSTKKNTAASRFYQAFTTRYNVYFNGDEHYKETIKAMEKNYEDDYSSMVYVHPAEAYNHPKAPQPQGNFDRSIEKAQKAIQLHSIKKRPKKQSGKSRDKKYQEWMKREEYNPFLHNAWLMMGRSQYLNGDFLGAASTFYYISKHFKWLPDVVTEAELWQARSYCTLGWQFEAENILVRTKPDVLTNNTLKGLYNLVYSDYYIKGNNYEKAIPHLIESIKYAKGSQKTRLRFLLGQVYALTGKKEEAYNAFKEAGSSASAPYRTKFNARIKQSEVYNGADIEKEVKALRRMTRYDRNKEYLDQIYYAIGNLYLSRQDTLNAIENYKLAAEKSTRNGIDKAINQITLGNLYFLQHKYDLAQPCYSEAVPQLPETYPNYSLLKKRSDVLDELAVYSQNVTLQDSLLRLSQKTPEEQKAIIDEIIRELKKKEKEEEENAKREAYLADQAAQGTGLTNNNAPKTFTLNTDDSWYFYNTATKNAGKTEFQKRWGSRKLEDDWRRRNKSSFDMSEFESDNEDEDSEMPDSTMLNENGEPKSEKELNEERERQKREEDPHYPEYYLKQIPKTDEEKQIAHEVIQEGLFNMGVILKDKLEDFNAAASEFDRLLVSYPDNIYRLDVYYNLYLMFMRQGKTALAERYRMMIVQEFPESGYGVAMRDRNYFDNLKEMNNRQESLYADAYEAYLNNDNSSVHEAYEKMMRDFPLSKIMPKFMFIHALAYVTEKNPEKFNATLKELLERYPETDITPLASSYLKQMAQGRQLESGATNMRGMLWDIRLSNDSTSNGGNDTPAEFSLDTNEPQLLVLTYPTDTVSANMLLYQVARHNFTSFVVKDFDLEQMNFGQLGLLLIKGFENIDELAHYRKVMAASTQLNLPPQVRPIIISVSNFDILLKQGRSFEEYISFMNERSIQVTEERVIPQAQSSTPEEETSDENQEIEVENVPVENVENVDVPTEQETQPTVENSDSTIIAPSEPNIAPKQLPDSTEVKPDVQSQEKDIKPTPAPKATQKTEENKTQNTQPTKPSTKPNKKPITLPQFPAGSEGDDPLLDTP